MANTPTQLVEELDQYIVGQDAAKRAVAVAVRNRWRRRQLNDTLAKEVSPRNIIMRGPTGCGKTEIARRLATLTGSPFIKVEATKFTEVGYHGRDVESMVRDLLEQAIGMIQREKANSLREKAREEAIEKVLDILLPTPKKSRMLPIDANDNSQETQQVLRERLRTQLISGELDDRKIDITTTDKVDTGNFMNQMGLDQFGPDITSAFERMMPAKRQRKSTSVKNALQVMEQQSIEGMMDQDAITQEAIRRTEQDGIIFIDEIDKIAMTDKGGSGADISRTGVQRDLLPIVEGSVINTRYGMVHTDHILFIAAGAFHVAEVSDLMPELQGRFPIRVELEPLTQQDFYRILSEKQGALPAQQQALLATEGLHITFESDSLHAMAELAFKANNETENIGARRLMTIVEKVFEVINYEADNYVASGKTELTITEALVRERVEGGPAGRRGWFRI